MNSVFKRSAFKPPLSCALYLYTSAEVLKFRTGALKSSPFLVCQIRFEIFQIFRARAGTGIRLVIYFLSAEVFSVGTSALKSGHLSSMGNP